MLGAAVYRASLHQCGRSHRYLRSDQIDQDWNLWCLFLLFCIRTEGTFWITSSGFWPGVAETWWLLPAPPHMLRRKLVNSLSLSVCCCRHGRWNKENWWRLYLWPYKSPSAATAKCVCVCVYQQEQRLQCVLDQSPVRDVSLCGSQTHNAAPHHHHIMTAWPPTSTAMKHQRSSWLRLHLTSTTGS